MSIDEIDVHGILFRRTLYKRVLLSIEDSVQDRLLILQRNAGPQVYVKTKS